MEGALLKWTNYLSGWQPRYFVLDSGILSYYDSQDDVGKGSKGSIKMAVCEIKVHPTDPTRMELMIPGEQYFYLKAGGAAERQKWLVALGSSKACLGDSRSQKDKDMHLSSESLGRKLSELRLYCDVLTQQVLDVQESTQPQDNGSPLDIEMNEASSLLRATCSQFISTLEECMKFANARLAPELYQPSPSPLPQDFVGTKLPHSHRVRASLGQGGSIWTSNGIYIGQIRNPARFTSLPAPSAGKGCVGRLGASRALGMAPERAEPGKASEHSVWGQFILGLFAKDIAMIPAWLKAGPPGSHQICARAASLSWI
ncbi:pleckstrin homology domain-containing family A member 3-like isoform X2 [Chelonoidis abingdonii]|uniref:pleckstrin homology domain-containing family A member 3-like isoform X2 n=1 Tax=Chelonoidis abingdonii TaxID=106734 RepID=UPI0013F23982|nr:pleckstrin homology domain-containing family A member 3-like isoform X2 [Chelonoidis abingdonii]